MDAVHSELVVSPPASNHTKSPPLAFAPTSNDSLAPLISPPQQSASRQEPIASATLSPSPLAMGLTSPQEQNLQVIVDQQANAIHLLHGAFAAERQVWGLEKDRLYQRIERLEHLLRARDHHSPAKSPIISPFGSNTLTSPSIRATSNLQRMLPIIAEDENIQPLSQRREGAPRSIDISGRPPVPVPNGQSADRSLRDSSVSFDEQLKVDEIPIPPPTTAKVLSPLPMSNHMHAGHTPIKATRPPTPPPKNMLLDGVEDTPTRNNTHINTFLTRSNDEEEDVALKGPLNLPELPNKPDVTNFTLEALSKRLEQIEHDPERARPLVFCEPSPGLASPSGPTDKTAGEAEKEKSGILSSHDGYISHSDLSSNTLSPSTAISPSGAPLMSPSEIHEAKLQHELDHGGIKLKKKPSTNFGAPFGQLGGFGSIRKMP